METLGGLASFHMSTWRATAGTPQEDFLGIAFIWFPAYLVGLILTFAAWNRCTQDKAITTQWNMLFWAGAGTRLICCFCNPWFIPLMLLSGRAAALRGAPLLPGELSILISSLGLLLVVTAVTASQNSRTRGDVFHWIGIAATVSCLLYPIFWCLLLPLRI
jgi:hypothetical protein